MSDLSPDARDLLERAKRHGFDPAQDRVDRVKQAVMQQIALGPQTDGGSSSAGSLAKWAKVVGACVALGGIAAIGVKTFSRPSVAPPPVTAPVATVSEPGPEATPIVAPTVTKAASVKLTGSGIGATRLRGTKTTSA